MSFSDQNQSFSKGQPLAKENTIYLLNSFHLYLYRLDLIEAQALIFHEGPAQQHYTLATTNNILSECAAISSLPHNQQTGPEHDRDVPIRVQPTIYQDHSPLTKGPYPDSAVPPLKENKKALKRQNDRFPAYAARLFLTFKI